MQQRDSAVDGTPAARPGGRGGLRFLPAGGNALVVELGAGIDPATSDAVIALERSLAAAAIEGILETVPTYRSLLIAYDPVRTSARELERRIVELERPGALQRGTCRSWRVPVAYGGRFGADLEWVAGRAGLAVEEVVRRHSAVEYRVYMLGFAPGFAYLGDLPGELEVSRRAEPRSEVPPGSISIGGRQTALSSVPMPSGWQLIGRTPLRPFDLRRPDPFLFRAGDRVRLVPVDEARFRELEEIAGRQSLRPEEVEAG